ncbi:MAG TPA: beta-galactosidase [Agromyces sp.]|nr:beta-galactosidase [Agromyces sp.]
MSNTVDRHERIALTNRYVEIVGRPAIPVSGELHYSRVPREEWEERLRLLRSGGITIVATYVFWNHHEVEPGGVSFDGRLDLAAFVRLCEGIGLDVVVRIGPWCHGEARNGGFPDRVQDAPVAHRTDDPAYLALVDEWFAALGAELAPLCGPASNVIGIQIENELYDQPGHIATLKRLARRHGMTAPIYTATAWGGAELPPGEVLPLYGGYGDGFWVDADHVWDTTFREHFFFSHTWDDPGIGADLRDHPGVGRQSPVRRLPSTEFPAATCELGGGMATAYHRRPLLGERDVAAVAHNKIGNGSGWQGYYMYGGGTNPRPGLQESHAAGYPNDLPVYDYDFHAPVGAAGELAASHAELRRQHAFLSAFGDTLADMPSSLPATLPSGVDDVDTLRWAIRSDGASAWLFITWQQPHVPLPEHPDTRFELDLGDESVTLPHSPVDIPAGTIAHWPVNLDVGGVRLRWITASPLTVLGTEDRPTLVVVAEAGIPVELAVDAARLTDASGGTAPVAPGVFVVDAAEPRLVDVEHGGSRLRVLVLPAASAPDVWVLGAPAARRLVLSAAPLHLDDQGRLTVRSPEAPTVLEFDVSAGGFAPVALAGSAAGAEHVLAPVPSSTGTPPPASYGHRANRASAPDAAAITRHGSAWSIPLPESAGGRRVLSIEWAGDVAVLEVDGRVVLDRFWDGTPWLVGVDALGLAPDAELTLRIVPLHPEADVRLPAEAESRRRRSETPLIALDAVRLTTTTLWVEEVVAD